MKDEKINIAKDKKKTKIFSIIIWGALVTWIGAICLDETGCGALLYFGLMILILGVCILVGDKKEQEISTNIQDNHECTVFEQLPVYEQSSQKKCKVENKIEMKAILKSIRNKIVKVLKSIYSFLRMIFSSPITTNIFLLIIVCMLSGIKYSVVHHSDYSLSSSEVTSAIKDALDDYGFIQVRRY